MLDVNVHVDMLLYLKYKIKNNVNFLLIDTIVLKIYIINVLLHCIYKLVSGQIPAEQIPPDIYPPLNKVIKYRKIKVHLFKKIYFYNYIHITYIL